MLAVAPAVEARGRLLWNHGGTADALWERGFQHLVSVPSPASDYFRTLPALLGRHEPRPTRVVVLHAVAGTFAPAVARGVAEGAAAAGWEPARLLPFASPLSDPGALLDRAADEDPDLVVVAGRFEDDLAVVAHRGRLPARTRLAAVAAGLAAFGRAAADAAEGVIGTSQWEPDDPAPPPLGPPAEVFVAEYRRAFGEPPEYVAAQAYALGVVLAECVRRAQTVDDGALLAAARGLRTSTFFGAFALDPSTLRQVGHRVRLVEWRGGRKVPLAP